MRTVEIHLHRRELSREMAAMRVWLDERRFEPSSFTCYDNGLGILMRIGFKVGCEAEWFAKRFGGQVNNPPPALVEPPFGSGIVQIERSPQDLAG